MQELSLLLSLSPFLSPLVPLLPRWEIPTVFKATFIRVGKCDWNASARAFRAAQEQFPLAFFGFTTWLLPIWAYTHIDAKISENAKSRYATRVKRFLKIWTAWKYFEYSLITYNFTFHIKSWRKVCNFYFNLCVSLILSWNIWPIRFQQIKDKQRLMDKVVLQLKSFAVELMFHLIHRLSTKIFIIHHIIMGKVLRW